MKFSGHFADFSLPDILRILIQSQKTGSLVIHYQGSQSTIFVNQGALHHAESLDLAGEKAVFNMLNFDGTAEFEFVEHENMPAQTLDSDLDTLIQNGISYLDLWRKATRKYPRFSSSTLIESAGQTSAEALSDQAQQILGHLKPGQTYSVQHLLEQAGTDPEALIEALMQLEQAQLVQIHEEKRIALRRFFLETANTLLNEFNSISGLKLKQEMNERLEKVIQDKNWMIEIQNGIIVDDKMHSSSLQEQSLLYSQCLNCLFEMIAPIYGKTFLQQVMNKVEQVLGPVQHWVKELKLEL